MKNDIYDYDKYKPFLNDLIRSKGAQGRGIKKALAHALGCQSPFISQVLSGDLDFNNDQTLACAQYFGLNREESEYLMLLVSYSKAATQNLKKFISQTIDTKRDAHRKIQNRMKMADSFDLESQATYYSSWVIPAIHIALTIPELRTRDALSQRLKLPLEKVDASLSFLTEKGLAIKEGTKFSLTDFWYHLDKSSPMINKHHTNLHLRSLQSLDAPGPHDVHYSAFFTCAKKDLPKLEELMLKTLEAFNELVRPSAEEELMGINLNLFRPT